MKKILFVCLLMLTLTVNAQDNSEFKILTIEFIKLTGTGDAFDQGINQIGLSVPEANKEAYTKEAKGTLGALYDKIAELYMSEFTKEEIKSLTDFYKSDLGKKLASKQMDLAQKAMSYGQSWAMEVQGIAQKHSN